MTIQNLVAQNKLKEAINLIEEDNAILLLSRLNSLERNERLGTISFEFANLERNRITNAILSYAGSNVSSYKSPTPNTLEDALNSFIRENKRRRPTLAEEANTHLQTWREYNDAKKQNPSFDVSGRRFKAIEEGINKFLSSLDEAKKDDLETIVQQVNELINPVVPSWEAIEKSYKLLVAYGFDDDYIRRNVELKPESNEAKIRCAENIENYLSKI